MKTEIRTERHGTISAYLRAELEQMAKRATHRRERDTNGHPFSRVEIAAELERRDDLVAYRQHTRAI